MRIWMWVPASQNPPQHPQQRAPDDATASKKTSKYNIFAFNKDNLHNLQLRVESNAELSGFTWTSQS